MSVPTFRTVCSHRRCRLAKLNAFDLVITVALGSTLSAILLQESIALAEGAVALGLLLLMQSLVTFVSVRSPALPSRSIRASAIGA